MVRSSEREETCEKETAKRMGREMKAKKEKQCKEGEAQAIYKTGREEEGRGMKRLKATGR